MTKLVTILARELGEWPEGATHAVVGSGNSPSGPVGVSFTENGPPYWDGIRFTIVHPGARGAYWKTSAFIENCFGIPESSDAIITREMWQAERERLSAPEWDGEGLPGVGIVCELRKRTGGWGEAEIKYISPTACVWLWRRSDGGEQSVEWMEAPYKMEFRPIKSDRDRWIESAESVMEMAVNVPANSVALGALYDAGLAKMPEVE